jgi:hypothetical protein
MAAGMTSVSVRFWDALAVLAATSSVIVLLLPFPARAEVQGGRTAAMTALEEQLIYTPEQAPSEVRQPVLGFLRPTEEGWKLDMLPGAVSRDGPLPALTVGADAPREDLTSHVAAPYAPLLRIDF